MGWDWGGAGQGAMSGAAAGSAAGPWGAAAGGVIGGVMGGFSGGKKNQADPMKEANKYYSQIPGTMKPYYDPYINAGNASIGPYQQMMQQMMQNPDEFINRMGQGYQKSPGYDWQMKQGQSAIGNANAAGGMAGTPQHEQMSAEMAQGLAGKDYNDYMNRIMQGFGMGTQGTANIFNTGANMSSDLATNLAQALMSQGNLAYSGSNNQNQQAGSQQGSMMGGMGQMFGNLWGQGRGGGGINGISQNANGAITRW